MMFCKLQITSSTAKECQSIEFGGCIAKVKSTHCSIWVVDTETAACRLLIVHCPTGVDANFISLVVYKRHAATATVQVHCIEYLQ